MDENLNISREIKEMERIKNDIIQELDIITSKIYENLKVHFNEKIINLLNLETIKKEKTLSLEMRILISDYELKQKQLKSVNEILNEFNQKMLDESMKEENLNGPYDTVEEFMEALEK